MVRLPLVGLLTFFVFIFTSAYWYPGGNRFNSQFEGYSFFGNFLCDLFHQIAYNGLPNPGRIFALIGTYTLALTLLLFWICIPRFFPSHRRHRKLVRIFGSSAMIISLFIATPLHDWCIIVAVPLGLVAFISSIHGLFKSGEIFLVRLGVIAMLMCAINYLALILNIYPPGLPGLQKITLIVFLSWVFAVSMRLNLR